MKDTSTYWTTQGDVRGSCGHQHRSGQAAQKCADADQRAVKAAGHPGAYSDRYVVMVEDGRPVADPFANLPGGGLDIDPFAGI